MELQAIHSPFIRTLISHAAMKTLAPILIAFLAFVAAPPLVRADNCSGIAQDLAVQYGAQVIKAVSRDGKCVVTLRIPGQGGQPPRVETKTVNS